ncbi:MAG TPA: polysaccharide biosynthesis tyrosine autokinase [Acidimicrobiia bacterium]|jgi:capsular exopolysaccharide synthesis family protein
MDLAAHFRVIAQNWLRILLISLGIAVLVFAASTVQSKKYEAKTRLEVIPGNAASNGQTLADASTYLAQNYAEYANTPTVVRDAIKTSGMSLDLKDATSRISASQVGDLGFVEVNATGPSKGDAERLSRFAASSLISTVQAQQSEAKFADLQPIQAQRKQLQTQLENLPPGSADAPALEGQISALNDSEIQIRSRKDDNLVTISGAIASDSPISPMPVRDSILAFVVSLVVVAELTVLVHYTGDRFSRTEDTADVTRITGLPVLAKIPKGSGIELVEAFRVLRTNLMVLEGAGKPRTLAVVSSNQSAGKTFTAVHLAQSAAGLDEKVVIVDADLRKPSVHERLGVPRAPGLSAVLQGNDLATMLRKLPDTPFLRVLASGAPVQDASAVLGARPFRHVLDSLRAVRLVVVDTPPAAMFADAMAVASQCDATIFVLDVKTSRRRQVRQTLEALERAGANLVGVVVNRTASPRRSSYYYEA